MFRKTNLCVYSVFSDLFVNNLLTKADFLILNPLIDAVFDTKKALLNKLIAVII